MPSSSVLAALTALLTAVGRTIREGQAVAARILDETPANHVAFLAPTGSGKSALAIGIGAAEKAAGRKTIISIHSNGLVSQYANERAQHEATGLTVRTIVGQAWYWCPAASPTLAGLTEAQRSAVAEHDGFLLAAGLDPLVARSHSVYAIQPDAEEEPEDDGEEAVARPKSPCEKCEYKESGCPLWQARREAARADVVITNTTLLGMKYLGEPERTTLVLDEAHTAAQPLREVLSPQVTIKLGKKVATIEELTEAASGKSGALNVLAGWAGNDEHPMCSRARKLFGKAKGRFSDLTWSVDGDIDNDEPRFVKVTVMLPCDLSEVLAPFKVIAMSGTLSQPSVDDLGLDCKVQALPGLDLSASSIESVSHPAWSYGDTAAWADATADRIIDAHKNGCAALVLFVSGRDMDLALEAVAKKGATEVLKSVIRYSAKDNRVTAIARYKAAPKSHILVGFIQGAGVGVDLPGELLRTVVVTRVPQSAPKGADQAKWSRDSRNQVVQAAGRAHRFEEDWGRVIIQGGFGRRSDIVTGLKEVGWTV
jgi:Rad3-related DNA helicase